MNPFDVLSSSAPSVFRTSPGQITSLALYSQALNETTWTAGPVPFPFSASERESRFDVLEQERLPIPQAP